MSCQDVVRRKMAVLYNLKNPVGVCFGVESDDSESSFLYSFEFPLVGMLTDWNALQFGGRLVEEEVRLGTTEVWSDMESGSGVQSPRDPQFLAGFFACCRWCDQSSLHLSPGAKLAYRASTCALHRFLSCAAVRTSLQDCHPALDLFFAPPGCFWPASLSPSLWGPCQGCNTVIVRLWSEDVSNESPSPSSYLFTQPLHISPFQ